MKTRPIALAAALAALAPGLAAAAPRAAPERTAIVVSSTAPVPGRALLRHAHRDAETMASVLVAVGGFGPERVHVLRDPEPAVLLATVEREASRLAGVRQAMLFFYYSGHAGDGALFTAGKPLAIEALRRALDRTDVGVRIGVLDACQGGDWTRAKGLVPDAPFEIALPPILASEGSALIASSSGTERAHESDALGASFFTHHFAAALRGAADAGRRGEVTLTQAFEYAREQTIRDTARQGQDTQHPSFALNLKGRQDVVLARVASSPSTLALDQADGPLQVIHLGSGLRMVELPPGPRSVVLAVPPGAYLVRRLGSAGTLAREVEVPRDGTVRVGEGELVLVGSERLAVKGEPDAPAGAMPRRWGGHLELGLGMTDAECCSLGFGEGLMIGTGPSAWRGLRFDGRLGFTDRFAWKIGTLAFAYGLGRGGGVEVVPYGGLLGWSRDGATREIWSSLGGGVGARLPVGPLALVATVAIEKPSVTPEREKPPPDYVASGALGFGVHLGEVVSIHLAAGVETSHYGAREIPIGYGQSFRTAPSDATRWSVGSVQELGFEQLPLLALHAPRGWSLNVHGAVLTSVDEPWTGAWIRTGVSKRF